MSQSFELLIIETSEDHKALWTKVFQTANERAEYIFDTLEQTLKYNKANPSPVCLSYIKIDNPHFTPDIPITDFSKDK